MGRFLFTAWPFRGHFFPMIAIARAVREAGHEVAFYSGSEAAPIIESEGFRCFPFEHVDEKRVNEMMFSRAAYASWRVPLQLRTLLRDWLLGTVADQERDLEAILQDWRPDVIVAETSMWGPLLVTGEAHGLPVAVFSTVVACLVPGPEAPLVGLGLPSPTTRPARLLQRCARVVVDLLSRGFRRQVDALRDRHGLPPLGTSVTEFAGTMPLYLVPSVAEFDRERRDLPPSVHYVGPCLWNQGAKGDRPAWLDQLSSHRPWVHVTEGTMHTQEPVLLRAAVQGLGGLPMEVILTTGGHRDPGEVGLGELPANVRVERWISHELLLPHLDVLVTTGGAGTVMAALGSGVPLIVVPTEWDKPENAQRVVEAGAGLRLSPRRCTPKALRAAVERVLGEPSFRENARRLAAAFRRHAGPARAAELLGSLLATGSAPRTVLPAAAGSHGGGPS